MHCKQHFYSYRKSVYSENCKCCSCWRLDYLVSFHTREGTVYNHYLSFVVVIFNYNKKNN